MVLGNWIYHILSTIVLDFMNTFEKRLPLLEYSYMYRFKYIKIISFLFKFYKDILPRHDLFHFCSRLNSKLQVKRFSTIKTTVLFLKKLFSSPAHNTEYHSAVRRTSTYEGTDEKDAVDARMPTAMALRRADFRDSATTGSSMQTAFQMSLTVLSFLAFGGYVISLVTQNMRRLQQPTADGTTVPQPLKMVVVNQQNRRPGLLRPTGGLTTVSYARRKRSHGYT